MENDISIRLLHADEIDEALDLAWRVFIEFEGPDYPAEGILTFKRFITYAADPHIIKTGLIRYWGCFTNGCLVGMTAFRGEDHICMLFVDKEFHKRGIARNLLLTAFNDLFNLQKQQYTVTVNSSPYAVCFYKKLGFEATGGEQIQEGIRSFPMRLTSGNAQIF